MYLEFKLLTQRTGKRKKKAKINKNPPSNESRLFNIEIVILVSIRALRYQNRLLGEVTIAKYLIAFEDINEFIKTNI